MKSLFPSLIVLFFILIPATNFSQWQRLQNLSVGWFYASAIDACDSNTVVISVRSNTYPFSILLTKNGGKTWNNLTWPFSSNTNGAVDLSITDSLHIWAALSDGRIIATQDGGKTWNEQFNDSNLTTYLNYLEMFDSNKGIAMGDCKMYGGVNQVLFFDELNGWIAGSVIYDSDGKSYPLLKTTDGGVTWSPKALPSNLYMHGINPKKIQFVDENTGWIFGSGVEFLSTTDKGETWHEAVFENTIRDFHFADDKYGWAVGSYYIYKSTDGGLNWIQNSQTFTNWFNSVYFANRKVGWAAGIDKDSYLSQIYKTTDGGDTWNIIQVFSDENFGDCTVVQNSLRFVDENTGFILLTNSKNNSGYVLETTDGGTTWSQKTSVQNQMVSAIQIKQNNSGNGAADYYIWVATDAGKIIFSGDLGMNWNEISTQYSNGIYSISFIDKSTGYIGGYNSSVLKTENGGANWQRLNGKTPQPAIFLNTTDGGKNWISQNQLYLFGLASGDDWRRLDFPDSDLGYFYGSGENIQKIYKTVNSGKNWEATIYTGGLQLLKFYDRNLGFAVNSDYNGKFIMNRTEDGAQTWQSFILPASGWASDLEFIPGNPSNIWFADYSNLYFSNDTGKTWQEIPGFSSIRDVKFTDANHGWMIGDNGSVYKTSNNGGMITNVNQEKELPVSFELYQNYPNPFNPTTIIGYKLPVAGRVSLKVFDFLGREVATLVNGYQQAGRYNSTFSILNSALSNGIYFYRLTLGNYSSTRKMVLLK